KPKPSITLSRRTLLLAATADAAAGFLAAAVLFGLFMYLPTYLETSLLKTVGARYGIELNADFRRLGLSGIDFGRKMKGESGGKTQFKKLTGRVTHQDGRTQLRKLVFDLGAINATGTADINDQGDIRGQLNIVLNIGATRQRTAVVLSGPFTPPYKELKWE
ncbi:MAG: hypothetical protein Q8N07_10780, partial [Rhodocyclaceae bacterium]|nr:hypothetical protein [Rhodocyclaceae bacterium]